MHFYILLLVFFALTSLSSTISSIAALLQINHVFDGFAYLGAALSLKMLSSSIFNYHGNFFISKLGIRRSFFLSQIWGILTLLLICLGFFLNNYTILLLGIISTSLPLSLVSILMTISFKVLNSTSS